MAEYLLGTLWVLIPQYVQCQWEFCVISVRKKEQKSGVTNPRIVYRGSQKFGFTISDTDFQNVAPDKKVLFFLVHTIRFHSKMGEISFL